MASYRWWMLFGAQTPELQRTAVRVLSQVTSAGSCETNWSTFDFTHSKKRNRLACPTVRNTVTVHCNLRLVDRIEQLGHCDDNIDWSSEGDNSEWLCFCCVLTFDSYVCCYALNLNVFCCSFCNNMQILISVVFLKLHMSVFAQSLSVHSTLYPCCWVTVISGSRQRFIQTISLRMRQNAMYLSVF